MRKLHLLIGLVFICEQCFGDSEYIVRYNGYFDETKRQEILKELNLIPAEKRKTQLSDFDVIESNAFDFSKHSLIRDIQLCNNSSTIKLSAKQFGPPQRRRPGLDILNVAKQIRADKLWARGFTGSSIKVAIFDSGLTPNRVHFKNVAAERDFTDESLPSDQVGHGTFVAGVIAGNNRKCPGISPNSELYIYKVFTKNQESKTKWFLDAFNDALQQKVHIINLSIGGSDYLDKLFMQKMEELISNGIIIVSAVGNDGPTFGSINNPADYTSVIGVGAINSDLHLARFSSRGLTTSEFPAGYGRVKPDIVTFGVQLRAAARNGGCRLMSGTSVATPLISGAIALLLSSIPPEKRNSMQIIQALHSGAERLNGLSIMEQGAGRFDLLNSFAALHSQRPQITFFPPYLDMNDCSYMWPYCSQPLYTTGMPLIVNISMHSGFNSSVTIKRISFECNENKSA
ncbi:Peptidase-S8 domain-containing protein [Aphelenchoides bicaudatus]|nr:Peptidase-S8 domain-containing protein [Aphelenchoides bicaudatus]